MEISKKNAFVEFIKKFWVYLIVGVVVFAVALTFTLLATLNNAKPTSISNLEFGLPMNNASIIKDFSDTELQENETLNQWEAHLSIDLASDSNEVFSVLDGTVASVSYDFLNGYTVTIDHADGFQSIYSSLDENVLVKEGDKVSAGQQIGNASDSAQGELDLGSHLHFTLLLNDNHVDPNTYLNLQEK